MSVRNPKGRTIRSLKYPILALSLLLLGELVVLQQSSYSKAWLRTVTAEEAIRPPTLDKLGGTSWSPSTYVSEPSLAPFALLRNQHCPGRSTFDTVVCLSNLLAARFAHGLPHKDVFDVRYDPAGVLQRHLAGEPGHCVTRSGIIATALLASGTPARLVQVQWFLPAAGIEGHNALEFWDDQRGWTMFDPTFGGYFEVSNGARSLAAVALAGLTATWHQAATVPAGLIVDRDAMSSSPVSVADIGFVSYVEPWLYTRVGPHIAPPPFNGTFVLVGPRAEAFVARHWALRAAIVATALAWAVMLSLAVLRIARRRRMSGQAGLGENTSESMAARAG